MDEREPLLSRPEECSGNEDITTRRKREGKRNKSLLIIFVAVAIIGVIAVILTTAFGTIAYGILFALYKNTDCANTTSSVHAHTRSGSYSLILEIPSGMLSCYKPHIHVSLDNYDSFVEIYQTPCEDIETEQFETSYELPSFDSYANQPRPVYDENFSPQNYFYGDGIINFDIVNLTTNLLSVNVVLCLFTSVNEFSDFKRAGKNWTNFTNTVLCNSIAVESGESYETTLNVTDKSFAFVGMVSTGLVHVDALTVTASGKDIDNPGENSTKACELSEDQMDCSFNLYSITDHTTSHDDVCIIAHEDGNPDGTYDYSDVALSLLKRDRPQNPYLMRLKSFGFSFCILLVLSVTVTAVVVGLQKLYWSRKLNNKSETNITPIQETDQHPAHENDT